MGLIKAGLAAAGSTLGDQWKEFFYCDAMDADVLVMKGVKRTGSHSSNKHGADNIISNGSGIAVADGQCMLIVEQGKVVEFCATPGEFTWDASTEPSLFTGDFDEALKASMDTFVKRFTMGGDTGKDQRVYYINTKEIMDNKFGTANPFMFTVVNNKIGMDRTVSVRCNGIYSYRITNPMLFYTAVCGNVEDEFTRADIDAQLKTEFVSALQPAFAKLSELELRPSQIPAHQNELEDAMIDVLKKKWTETRGITICSIALNPITLNDEDLKKIQAMEDAASYGSSAAMMAGRMGEAQASAMEAAASNTAGAMNGFVGMGMAMNAGGGMNVADMFAMGQQQAAAKQAQAPTNPAPQPQAASWTCSCGQVNSGKFCSNCGSPAPATDWTCSCGQVNSGKFCSNCGSPRA